MVWIPSNCLVCQQENKTMEFEQWLEAHQTAWFADKQTEPWGLDYQEK